MVQLFYLYGPKVYNALVNWVSRGGPRGGTFDAIKFWLDKLF